MSNTRAIFYIEGKTINDVFPLGSFCEGDQSSLIDIKIKHTSRKPIRNCKLYISEYSKDYNGTNSSKIDYDKIVNYGTNFQNYGIKVFQEYKIYGQIWSHRGDVIIDTTRLEKNDVFSGQEIEILSGASAGEKRRIKKYNVDNGIFYLENDFLTPVEGERYSITIKTEHTIKSGQGTSRENAIPLIYKAGMIDKQDEAKISFLFSVPPYAYGVGSHYFDFNLDFTPEE